MLPDYVKEKIWLKSYPPQARTEPVFPEKPIFRLVEEQAERFPERGAMIFLGREITLGRLLAMINACGAALWRLGVRKGDRVAIYLPNCPAFAVVYFGAMKIGAVITAISPLAVSREIEFQLKDSQARVLFAFDQYLPRVAPIEGEVNLKERISVSLAQPAGATCPPGWLDFQELLTEKGSAPEADLDLRHDLAVLQYTGGTTGTPKGVMLSHFNVMANVIQTNHWDQPVLKKYNLEYFVKACVLPWYHIYGQTVDMSCGICNGHKLVVFPRFEPAEFLKGIERHKIQIVTGAPPIFIRLVNEPTMAEVDLSSLIWCNNGAGPLPVEVINRFERLSGGVTIYEGFGLSEASPVTNSSSPAIIQKKGSVGIPYPGTEEAIWDIEKNEYAPLNQVGELLISGPQVMRGYWGHAEESERSFLKLDGRCWLKTGDLARMDEDGYVWIVDRAKDLIKYKGHSVFPREVEEVLHQHPAVLEVAVVGVPDPEVMEKVKAFVVLRPEARGKVSAAELIDWTAERLSSYKVPRLVEFREELPKSHAGKYLKRELR